MHFIVSIAVAALCGLMPWVAARLPTRWAAIGAAPLLLLMIAGVVFGLQLYPASDLVVAAFGVLGGIVLGRAMPPRFRPFLVLLVVLSVLDVAQNLAFSGPGTGPPPAAAQPDPHLIWLNFRIPLAAGHFNIGFADLTLIAAIGEHLRRRRATVPLSLLPGVIGLGLGEALVATLPQAPPQFVRAVSQSLVPFLTAGYLLTELAVEQMAHNEPV